MSKNFLDLLKHQAQVSAVTNSKTTTRIAAAVQRKDIIGVGAAIKDELASGIKGINEEITKAKQEFVSEWKPKTQNDRGVKSWEPPKKKDSKFIGKDCERDR